MQPSDDLIDQASDDTIVTAGVYTLFAEFRIYKPGTYRLKWEFASSGAYVSYTKPYLNGVAYGTERTKQMPFGTYEAESEDLFCDTGDYLQIYGKCTNAGEGLTVKNPTINGTIQLIYGEATT